MSQTAHDLIVQIEASTELLRREMRDAVGVVDGAATKMEGRANKLDDAFAKLGAQLGPVKAGLAGLASAFSIQQVAAASLAAIKYGDDIGDMAERLGITTDFLQEFRYAVEQSGGDVESADSALEKFTDTFGEALRGNEQALQSFLDLGVSLRDLGGEARPLEDVFGDIANAIAQIPDQNQRLAVTRDLFGKSGGGLVALLAAGADNFNRLGVEAKNANQILGNDTVEAAGRAQAAYDKLTRSFHNSWVEFVVGVGRMTGAIAEPLEDKLARLKAWRDEAKNNPVLYARRNQDVAEVEGQLAAIGRSKAAEQWAAAHARAPEGLGLVGDPKYALPGLPSFTVEGAGKAKTDKPFTGLPDLILPPIDAKEINERIADFNKADAEVIARARESLERQRIDNLRTQADITKDTRDAFALRAEAINAEIDLEIEQYKRLRNEADPQLAALYDQLIQLKEAGRGAAVEAEKLRTISEPMKQVIDGLSGQMTAMFAQMVTDGKLSFKSLGNFIKQTLAAELIFKPLQEGLKSLLGGLFGGGGGLFGGFLGGLFGRAEGGNVNAGQPYLVGERGPEIFTPAISGSIINNTRMRAAGGQPVTVIQNIRFDVGLETVDARIGKAAPSIAQAAQKAIISSINNRGIARA